MNTNRTRTGLLIVTQQGDRMVISKQKVMKSAAGYYIGCGYIEEMFLNPDETMQDVTLDMLQLPYSRDSGYFPTEAAAQTALNASEGSY